MQLPQVALTTASALLQYFAMSSSRHHHYSSRSRTTRRSDSRGQSSYYPSQEEQEAEAAWNAYWDDWFDERNAALLDDRDAQIADVTLQLSEHYRWHQAQSWVAQNMGRTYSRTRAQNAVMAAANEQFTRINAEYNRRYELIHATRDYNKGRYTLPSWTIDSAFA